MNIIELNLKDLKPYEKNPRKNDEAVKYVKESIKQFGFKVPIVVDKNNIIIAGHTRYKASKELGLIKVPCIIADDLTEEQVKAFRLADNKVSEKAEWDLDLLNDELFELKELDFDMDVLGFENVDFNDEEQKEIVEDDVPELPKEAITKYGDIWQLGEHRLMCGDSTKEEDVAKLMDGNSVDMLLTDPPYGIDYSSKNSFLNAIDKGNRIQKDIINDNIEDYKEFFSKVFENIKNYFNEYNTCYVFLLGKELHNLRLAFDEQGYHWNDYLVWVKNNHVLGRNDYNCKLEYIMYGWFGKHKFYGGFNTNVLEFKRPSKSDLHPTMKPLELLSKLIQDGTKEKGNVLDVFGGSGSTLIACEQLNRKCYMMELDPKYCDVIITRWETLTGKKAELIKE